MSSAVGGGGGGVELGGEIELGDEVAETIDWGEVPFSSDEVRATVSKGDTRTLETVSGALEAFRDYQADKEDSVLVLGDVDGDEVLVIPHNHRWTPEYRQQTYAKLKAAERFVRRTWGEVVPTTLLTLTAPHKDENGEWRAIADVMEDLSDGWDKARRVLDRELDGAKTEYLAVWEPHKTGYPHLHVIVFGAARPSVGEKIVDMWTERYVENASENAQSVDVRRNRSAQIENPAAYVMKYLSKTLAREETDSDDSDGSPGVSGFEVFSALLWATGKRHYSMSQGLSAAVKDEAPDRDTNTEWEFLGTATGLEPGRYTGENAKRVVKFIGGSKSQQIPPDPDEGGRELQQSSMLGRNASHYDSHELGRRDRAE